MTHNRLDKVCCFGELLLRFALPQQWISQQNLSYYIGGAELNVATALAQWGINTSYITSFPDNYIGNELVTYMNNIGISTQNILYSGKRIGTYYLPVGNDVKSQGVIYDREYSSFSMLKTGMIDWDAVLHDCTWFHFSAISPALNSNVALVCKEAVEAADAKGLKISVDLNFRSKLWKYDIKPPEVMRDIVKHCDVIMGNMWSAESLLGIESPIKNSIDVPESVLSEGAIESMNMLQESFPKANTIAYTHRFTDKYWGIMQQNGRSFISDVYKLEDTIGPVGSGDCFIAGLIYALVSNFEPKEIVDFATSAAVGKLYETGDATKQSIEYIKERMYGNK